MTKFVAQPVGWLGASSNGCLSANSNSKTSRPKPLPNPPSSSATTNPPSTSCSSSAFPETSARPQKNASSTIPCSASAAKSSATSLSNPTNPKSPCNAAAKSCPATAIQVAPILVAPVALRPAKRSAQKSKRPRPQQLPKLLPLLHRRRGLGRGGPTPPTTVSARHLFTFSPKAHA